MTVDRWKPLKENTRVACLALGGYVLTVSAVGTLVEIVPDGHTDADSFGFVVLVGVAAAGGWMAFALLFNLWALWLNRGRSEDVKPEERR